MKTVLKSFFHTIYYIPAVLWILLATEIAGQGIPGGHSGGAYASGGEEPASVTAVDLKIMLQGPFNGLSMNTDLAAKSLLPAGQVFNVDPAAPWYYAGSEAIAPGADLSNTVNWVLLELRTCPGGPEMATSATMKERCPALLQSDGSVKAPDAQSIPRFGYEDNDHVYIVVWCLNHLPVMNALPPEKLAGKYDWDFTDDQAKAWQKSGVLSNPAMKSLGGGIYGMYAGDCRPDSLVHYTGAGNDRDEILSTVGSGTVSAIVQGYLVSDLNMDGVVKYTGKVNDKTVLYNALEGDVGKTLRAHIPD